MKLKLLLTSLLLILGLSQAAAAIQEPEKPIKEEATKEAPSDAAKEKAQDPQSLQREKADASVRQDGAAAKEKGLKSARPNMERSNRGARPNIERPAGAGRPTGAGRPEGARRPDRPGRPDHPGRPENPGRR